MHSSQGGQSRDLLTALEVQDLLHVDRSTVYRMAEDGRLPAIRVGRSWRFPASQIEAMLPSQERDAELASPPSPTPAAAATHGDAAGDPGVPGVAASASAVAVEVAADLLGVMMVVTDMHGRPITAVCNPSRRFAERVDEPETLQACISEWRDLADHPDLTPRFQTGTLGFECARAFIRQGTTLVGMVLAGGVSPSADPTADPDLYHLDDRQREHVLSALPRIAAAIATSAARDADTTSAAPATGTATKENR